MNNVGGTGWTNVDGSNATYFDWAPEEPANSTGSNGCVSVDLKGLWHNDDCFNVYPYVCEIFEADSSSTSQPSTTPESSPFTCHAYFPLVIDITEDMTPDEFSTLKNFIITSLLKELFPINLQPSSIAAHEGDNGRGYLCKVPNDVAYLITEVNAIHQEPATNISDIRG